MQNKHNLIAALLGFIAIIAIAAYLMFYRQSPVITETATSTGASSSTSSLDLDIRGGSATITENLTDLPPAPDYRKPLTFSASTEEAVKVALQKQFDATVEILDKDKTSFQAWVNLGTLRKMTGDYKGAEADWKYVTLIYPSSTVGFDNLGGLYLDFIKDYAKAEAMFKQSIRLDPQDINAYGQLFSLYTTYGYKAGTSAASDLVTQGLKANPNNQILLQFQSQLDAQ